MPRAAIAPYKAMYHNRPGLTDCTALRVAATLGPS